MSSTTQFATAFLKFYFQRIPIPNIADDATVDPVTEIFISFHTASPGAAGVQTSHECSYTGYVRVLLARSDSAWAVTGAECNPKADVEGSYCSAGTETISHWGIGRAADGSGVLDFYGEIDTPFEITATNTPKISSNTKIRIT